MLKETIKENGKILKHMIISTTRFSQIKINKMHRHDYIQAHVH